MVNAHLFSRWPAVGILEHFFQEFYQLARLDFILDFLSRIIKSIVFPPGVDLLFQGHYSVG
jgi:hypothetical protein